MLDDFPNFSRSDYITSLVPVRGLLPPSYHCRGADDSLVFVEFGIEFLDEVAAAGLEMTMYFYNVPADDSTWVAVCRIGR
jgi:hypothetical protein